MKNKYTLSLLVTIIFTQLIGCNTHEVRKSRVEGGIGVVGSNVSTAIQRMKEGDIVDEARIEDYIVSDFWVNPVPIITAKKERDPELNRRFSYVTSQNISIEKLAQDIGLASGVQFTLAPEVIYGLRLSEKLTEETDVTKDEKSSGNSNKAKDLRFITSLRAAWVDTTLFDVVSQLTSQLNISWRYNKSINTIHLYKFRSETYDVHLPGENIEYSTRMSNESLVKGDGSASVSGSSISTDVGITTDPWVGLTERLRVITTEGGRFSTDRANFKVTVNDTDVVHEKFTKMLAELQKDALKQIVFDISLLTVTGSQKDLYGLNFEALYENTVNASLSTLRPVDAALSAASLGVDKSTVSHVRKANAFVDALSSYGQAMIVNNYQKSTLNNQVTSIVQSRNRPYLRQVSIPVEGSNFNQNGEASLTDLITGFSLSVRPHLINESEMLVSLTINRRSAPDEFESVDAGAGIFLERPDIKDDSEFQQFIIGDNQTKIIAGAINEQSQTSSSGAVDRDMWWLGGSSGLNQERIMMVIFITARIL